MTNLTRNKLSQSAILRGTGNLVDDPFQPNTFERVQIFKFHSRFRKLGETVATFVSELHSLAEFCSFGATLEDMLIDRIVRGINNVQIQRRLLAESKLTFSKALEIVQGLESAAKNMKELTKGASQETSLDTQKVHKIIPRGSQRSQFGSVIVSLPPNVFVVSRQVKLVRIIIFEHFHVTHVAKWDIWQKFVRVQLRSKRSSRKKAVHHVEETAKYSSEEGDLYAIHSVPKLQPYKMNVEAN